MDGSKDRQATCFLNRLYDNHERRVRSSNTSSLALNVKEMLKQGMPLGTVMQDTKRLLGESTDQYASDVGSQASTIQQRTSSNPDFDEGGLREYRRHAPRPDLPDYRFVNSKSLKSLRFTPLGKRDKPDMNIADDQIQQTTKKAASFGSQNNNTFSNSPSTDNAFSDNFYWFK